MAKWRTISIDLHTKSYKGVTVLFHIIEAQCPYCDHFSTQQVVCGDNEMSYDFCPRCGNLIERNEEDL